MKKDEKVSQANRLSTFDIAEHLRTKEEIGLYIDACIAESKGDLTFVIKALQDVDRAQKSMDVAERCRVAHIYLVDVAD